MTTSYRKQEDGMKKKKWLKISIIAVAVGAVLAVVTRKRKKYGQPE